MDRLERKIISHYFKKYKNNEKYKQCSGTRDTRGTSDTLNTRGILDGYTFTLVDNCFQSGGNTNTSSSTSILEMNTDYDKDTSYDNNDMIVYDSDEIEYIPYDDDKEYQTLFERLLDNDCFLILLGIITGFIIVRYFMPHLFPHHLTSPYYNHLGEGIANIVMETKSDFLGDPK